jgi:hypothetical protein
MSDQNEKADASQIANRCRHLWQFIANQARCTVMLLPLNELEWLQEQFNHAETIGPILDPTAFVKLADSIPRRRELLKATVEYVRVLDRLKQEESDALNNSKGKGKS